MFALQKKISNFKEIKTMKSKNLFLLLMSRTLLVFVFAAFVACGGGENKDDKKEDTTAQSSEVKESLQKVLTDVPKPSEMPYQLKATGADFMPKLPNAPANVEKYKTTNNKAALNLGVFSTDVGYVSVYEQVQNALDYIKSATELADKVGVSSAFDPKVKERFEKNLKNLDTLTKIINESLATSDKYLKDNERNNIAALIFTGTFMEGLYIATQIVDSYPDDILPKDAKNEVLMGLVRIITEQDKPLGELLKALNSLEKDKDITELTTKLEELQKLYKALNVKEKIEKNQGNLILTDETIKGITEKVKEIRTWIVS